MNDTEDEYVLDEIDKLNKTYLCKCCGDQRANPEDEYNRCLMCAQIQMVPSRRGWRQLGVYDG